MLEAYFDESGTDHKNKVVGVGGFIATRKNWESFADEWRVFLKDENIVRFHRVDLENFQKEFKEENGWDATRGATG